MRRAAFLALASIAWPILAAEELTLPAGDSIKQTVTGATGAYSTDPAIAEAAAVNGIITISGRSPGTTQLTVLTPSGPQTFRVVVKSVTNQTILQALQRDVMEYGVRYSSTERLIYGTVAATIDGDNRKSELQLTSVSGLDGTALREFTYRFLTSRREVVLFDEHVDHSPLTMHDTVLRGVHWREGSVAVHAGVLSTLDIESFLIPVERRSVFGASYSWTSGESARWKPSIFYYPTRGGVATLLYEDRRGEHLEWMLELGIAGSPAIAGRAAWHNDRKHLEIDFEHRSRRFPSLSPGDIAGTTATASWGWRNGKRFATEGALTVDRYDAIASLFRYSATFRQDVHVRLKDQLTLVGGATYGSFGQADRSARSVAIPLGLAWETPRAGISAIPRWTASSVTNRGALGLRLGGRVAIGTFRLAGYFDQQKDAPTVEAIFREHPQLQLAFEELGITASSPEEVARLIRENAALAALGFADHLAVNVAPIRRQLTLEASWVTSTERPQELRMRYSVNRNEGVSTRSESSILTLGYSRRLSSTSVVAAVSLWRNDAAGIKKTQPSYEIGIGRRFHSIPDIFSSRGTQSISGTVFRDDEMTGKHEAAARGIRGVRIELDTGQHVTSDENGKYVFRGVPRGSRQLTAHLNGPAQYFTTPSSVRSGSRPVDFGVAEMPARVFGFVRDDTGRGIANVMVLLIGPAQTLQMMIGADGKYSFVAKEGTWRLTIDSGSLPVGYSLQSEERQVTLVRNKPVATEFRLTVDRSISGRIAGGETSVEIPSLGRKTRSGTDGSYTFRSLPPGELTIVVRRGHLAIERTLVVPADPCTLRGIDISDAAASFDSGSAGSRQHGGSR